MAFFRDPGIIQSIQLRIINIMNMLQNHYIPVIQFPMCLGFSKSILRGLLFQLSNGFAIKLGIVFVF